MHPNKEDTIPVPTENVLSEMWIWELMSPAQRRHRLRTVAGWVDWLRATYTLNSSIPACWYAHPLVLQHLTALHVAWIETYFGENTHRALALFDWHDALWRTIDRIHRHTPNACLDGQHTEAHTPHQAPDTGDSLATFTSSAWGTHPPRTLSTLHQPAALETPKAPTPTGDTSETTA